MVIMTIVNLNILTILKLIKSMGLNLYLKRVPTQSDKRKMSDLLTSERYDELKLFIELCTQQLHLCKLSYGWQAIFDLNGGEYYAPTRDAIIKFCQECGYIVIGAEHPMNIVEAFDYIDEHNNNPKNTTTVVSYNDGKPNTYYFYEQDEEFLKILRDTHGIGLDRIKYHCFENDGLWFDVATDWC